MNMKGNIAYRKMQLRNMITGMKEARESYLEAVALGRDAVEEYTEQQIQVKEAELQQLEGKQELEKAITQKTQASTFRISDINSRNATFQRSIEKKASARGVPGGAWREP